MNKKNQLSTKKISDFFTARSENEIDFSSVLESSDNDGSSSDTSTEISD